MNEITLKRSEVVFYGDKVENPELRHTYWLGEKQLQGVTSTLMKVAFPDMYKGISKAVLDNAAERGHNVHDAVEAFAIFGGEPITVDEANFQMLQQEHGFRVLETEYLVSDEKELASAIDIVAQDKDGDIILIDIKTTSDRHYDAVSLQLSIYADWFEKQNPKHKVKALYLLWLRDGECRYEQVPRVRTSKIKELKKAWQTHDEGYVYDDSPRWLPARCKKMSQLMEQIEKYQKQLDDLKAETLTQMQDEHYYSLKSGNISISKVAATMSPRFDAKKFQQYYPDLYSQYVTMTKKKEYITIKKGK